MSDCFSWAKYTNGGQDDDDIEELARVPARFVNPNPLPDQPLQNADNMGVLARVPARFVDRDMLREPSRLERQNAFNMDNMDVLARVPARFVNNNVNRQEDEDNQENGGIMNGIRNFFNNLYGNDDDSDLNDDDIPLQPPPLRRHQAVMGLVDYSSSDDDEVRHNSSDLDYSSSDDEKHDI